MTELEDIVSSLSDVKDAVNDSQHAIVAAMNSVCAAVKGIGGHLFGWGLSALVGVWLITSAENLWHAEWRYAQTYGVSSDKVQIAKEPHDCDFIAAPLGAKYCHYDRVVSTMRWGTSKSTGNAVASYDEGKTWSNFTPDPGTVVPQYSTVEAVYVTWEKKD
jgi:hypothetical protein